MQMPSVAVFLTDLIHHNLGRDTIKQALSLINTYNLPVAVRQCANSKGQSCTHMHTHTGLRAKIAANGVKEKLFIALFTPYNPIYIIKIIHFHTANLFKLQNYF